MECSKSAKIVSSYRPSYFQKSKNSLLKLTGSKGPLPSTTENHHATTKTLPSPRKAHPALTLDTESHQMTALRPVHEIYLGVESPQTQTPKETPKITPKQTPKEVNQQPRKKIERALSAAVEKQEHEAKEGVQQIEGLVESIEQIKHQRTELQANIQERRKEIEQLKKQIEEEDSPQNKVINYVEKIAGVQTMMKYKKNMHEEELNALIKEKTEMQQHNSALLKEVQALQQERNQLAHQEEVALGKESLEQLQLKITRAKKETLELEREEADLQRRINNSQELRAMGLKQFQRYADLFKKRYIGREIAEAREGVKQAAKPGRWASEVSRKRALLKQKRVENAVRKKTLLELQRVVNLLRRDIEPMKHLLDRIQ